MIKYMLMNHLNHEAMKEVADAVAYMVDFAPMVWTPLLLGCLLGLSAGVIYQGFIDLYKFYKQWE